MVSGSGSQTQSQCCVGSSSPSTPAPLSPSSSPQSTPLPTRRTLFSQSTESPQRKPTDECFSCKRKGHWAPECPNKTPKMSQPGSSSPAMNTADLPLIRCPCGRGVCPILTSKTEKNPGKKFFGCPAGRPPPTSSVRTTNHPSTCFHFRGDDHCNFFLWCNEVAEFRAPKCPCGAGSCSLVRESSGPNAGRWFFACRLKKGHGACLFRLWAELRLQNLMNKHLPRNNGYHPPRSHQFVGTVNSKQEQSSEMELEFSGTQNFESSPNSPMKIVDLKQDVHNEIHGNLVTGVENSLEAIKRNTFQSAPIVSQSENHDRQTECLIQISALGEILNEDVIYLFLGVRFSGWLGRLAFPPSQYPKEPVPVPFFCCIFPSFDPVPVLEDVEMCDSKVSNFPTSDCCSIESDIQPAQTPPKDGGISRALLWEPSGLKNCPSSVIENREDCFSGSILKTFGQGLLNILESLNPVDHGKMLNVAEATFDALHRMSIDHGPFSKIVMEFVHCSSKLAEIEGSMHKELNSETLIDIYGGKKAQYDHVSHLHKAALGALKASENRRKSLGDEVARVKFMLLELEKLWCSCEAETLELQRQVAVSLKEMVDAEGSMEAACKEMEETLELEQQRETVMDAAKEALERARSVIKLV